MDTPISCGPHIGTPLVAGKPFSAKIEITTEQAGSRYSGFLAQDGFGRSRYVIDFVPELSIITIADPVGEKKYVLNTGTKELKEREYPRARQIWSEMIHESPPLAEKRVIEGVECYRHEFSQRGGEHGERRIDVTAWMSPRIGLVEEEAIEDGKKNTWRLYDINLSEPDPKLFERPELPR